MRTEFLIAKRVYHQARPEIIDVEDRSWLLGFAGKTVARQIGHNHIKSVFGVAPESHRVSEQGNYLCETVKRIWISMRENDAKWIRLFAALMNEVDCDLIYLCSEVRELIESRLVLLPVIGISPVTKEFD